VGIASALNQGNHDINRRNFIQFQGSGETRSVRRPIATDARRCRVAQEGQCRALVQLFAATRFLEGDGLTDFEKLRFVPRCCFLPITQVLENLSRFWGQTYSRKLSVRSQLLALFQAFSNSENNGISFVCNPPRPITRQR
jgi:hypothetical protein